jgi:phosphate transport system substrate-binding protein
MKKFFVLLAIGCLLPVTASAGTIEYAGSSTVGKFIADASTVYTGATFKLNTSLESAGGEQCAARGKCALGGVARKVKQRFLEEGVKATLIGKDAISVIVHKDNPVKKLTRAQLKDIFTGKIKNWKIVGGPDLAIQAIIVKEGSSTREIFRKVILAGSQYRGTKVVTPDARIVSLVARHRGVIGQISMAFIKDNKKVKAIYVDGQEPSVNNANYPITRPLHLVTKGEPRGEIKAFIDWALSAEGQKVVRNRFLGVN